MQAIQEAQADFHRINEEHGFNDFEKNLKELETYVNGTKFESFIEDIRLARQAQKLMLIVSELSEALDAIRKGNQPDSHIPQFTGEEAELADAVIRIANMAGDDGSRLAEAIVEKSKYNDARPHRHGGKKF